MASKTKGSFQRIRHWLADTWLFYIFIRTFITVFAAMPLSWARFLGWLGGHAVYLLDRGHRRVCLENLAIAFPEKSVSERLAILKASYVHLGLCAADVCRFKNISAEELLSEWIVPEEGARERSRAVISQGKGLIGVSAHIGFWELAGFSGPALGYGPMLSVSQQMKAPRVEAFINSIRSRMGNQIVRQEGALKPILRTLKEGRTVGIIMDQYGGRKSPWVPFFGREASTVDSAARLHLKTGAPLHFNLMIRRPDGRYTWRCRNIDPGPLQGTEEQRIHQILRVCNQEFELAIRETPEQWLWMHRRWKPQQEERNKIRAMARG